MERSVAPWLASELELEGWRVETFGFVDADEGPNGFLALEQRLEAIRDDWIDGSPSPTRVVLVAHSHGGPWAHAATRDVPDCPVRCLVDLDSNSYGWELNHASDAALGGNPVDRYAIPVTVNPPEWPEVRSETDGRYDLEDVVFPSVRDALEVVTGALVPDLVHAGRARRYDERWNARFDGTTTGLARYFSGTAHSEPALHPDLGGRTLLLVRDWLVERLATP
jgi:hypothetical protein